MKAGFSIRQAIRTVLWDPGIRDPGTGIWGRAAAGARAKARAALGKAGRASHA